eukprot:TRINITY_DN8710_c1_g1_i1.p1 TRINITY_DN8710_c1_g1~~TRINITY_DN8710_c1_g1_i1.p1  ORF type:complete len:574 (+),score=66.31 TRINITY_DN8710_c1_g1_i1:80-1801(+)
MRSARWRVCRRSALLAALAFSAPELVRSANMEEWEGLYRKLDKNRDGFVDVQEAQKGGYSKEHLLYYDTKVVDDRLDVNEVVAFVRERSLYKKADFSGPDPKGHMQPLGMHAPPGPPPDEFEPGSYPHPSVFWKEYIQKHKAAVFRQAARRAKDLWDPDYLKKNFGWVEVKLEPKNESRLESPEGAYKDIDLRPEFRHHRTTVTMLLDNPELNLYAISILPQAMSWDIDMPPSLLCGSRKVQYHPYKENNVKHPYPHPTGKDYLTHIVEANLWLASGFTRSQLHYDKENIYFCSVRAVKEFILIDTRKYGHKIPWARGGKYNAEDDLKNSWTDWVTVDPMRVDMRLYTFLQDVEYMYVKLLPGDCIFMPYSMVHQVTTHREEVASQPNVVQSAVSFMITPDQVFDEEACKDPPLDPPIPFGAYDLLWYYDGTGVIPQGYPLPHDERDKMAGWLKQRKTGLTKKNHRNIVRELNPESWMLRKKPEWIDDFTREFNDYAKDKKKGLRPADMHWNNTPIELWLRYSALVDGMLPCDDGEVYSPRTPQVWEEMEAALLKVEAAAKELKVARGAKAEL